MKNNKENANHAFNCKSHECPPKGNKNNKQQLDKMHNVISTEAGQNSEIIQNKKEN